MEKKELNMTIEKMNRVIENYKESLNLFFKSKNEDEEDNRLVGMYARLVDIRVNANVLKNKIDDYLMDKKFYEEDE